MSALLFGAISAPFLLAPIYLASPVISGDELQGEIVSVRTTPANPKVAVGRGFRYEYGIRLNDGGLVYVRGPIAKPKKIGDTAFLMASRHENGRTSYRFVDTPANR